MNILHKITIPFTVLDNWGDFIADYARVKKGDYILRTKSGLVFITRAGTSDAAEIVVTVANANYQLDMLRLGKHPVIVDLGGYIGDFALHAHAYFHHLHPKIYTFEPSHENFRYLQANVILNGRDSDITSLPIGVASRSGAMSLDTSSKRPDEFSLSAKTSRRFPVCTVRTLPDICKEYGINSIDVLKIDIEGGEYDLFSHRKTMEFINTNVKHILIEPHAHPVYGIGWISDQLSAFQMVHHRDFVYFFSRC